MATKPRPAKAKTAERVVEVLDYFDEQHRCATVMDIARRYNRPQSSTSELLASLVDLGLLYKDPIGRSYTLTPRAAIMGSLAQPWFVRDGRLSGMIDDLRAATGRGVALVGLIGPSAQLFRWRPGVDRRVGELVPGARTRLTDSAAGWLLLGTMADVRREGLIRRLNAEAPEEARFSQREMGARIAACAATGDATGAVGFGSDSIITATLVQPEPHERPLVVGLVHERPDEAAGLAAVLRQTVRRWIGASGDALPTTAIAHAA